MTGWCKLLLLVCFCAECAAHRPGRALDPLNACLAEARAAYRKGEYAAAVERYRKAAELDGKSLEAHRGIVRSASKAGMLEAVMVSYSPRLEKDPDDHVALYALGLANASAGGLGLKKAEEYMERASRLSPAQADYHYRLGLLYLEDEEFEKARDRINLATQADSSNPAYYPALALCHGRLGNRKAAMENLGRMLELRPTRGQLKKARSVVDLLYNPFKQLPAWVGEEVKTAIELLDKEEFPDGAAKILEQLLAKRPDLPLLHTLMGLACQKMAIDADALLHFKEAIKLDPLVPLNYLYVADMFQDRRQNDKAREFLMLAIETDPLNTGSHKKLAAILFAEEDYKEALRFYGKAKLSDPDDIEARYQIGRCYFKLGELDRAEKEFTYAAKRGRDCADCLVQLGMISANRGFGAKDEEEKDRFKEMAIDYLEKALEVEPANTAASELLQSLEGPR